MNADITDPQRRRYRLLLEYDGSDFVGWQVQTNGRTVQGELERALLHLFGEPTRVHGAGRTDTGVHATGQVAHFDLESRLDGCTMLRALNAELPPDITVRSAELVDPEFHARFSASSRSYEYSIVHERVSLARRQQWTLYVTLDHAAIHQAVDTLIGTHDFTTFSKYAPEISHHFCHVFDASWEHEAGVSRFRIRANRFLQGMVRSLVGGLVHVGRHRLSPSEFGAMLASCDRGRAPMLAPAHGLVLTGVAYDEADRAVVREIMEQLRLAREMEE